MITTGMTADLIEKKIKGAKGNPRERMKGVTLTLQNELLLRIRISVARNLRGTVHLNARKMHVLMFNSRFRHSLRNVSRFLFCSDEHLIQGARRSSCANFL